MRYFKNIFKLNLNFNISEFIVPLIVYSLFFNLPTSLANPAININDSGTCGR